MKYFVLVGDGMGDRPIDELGGKTPLEAAHTPNMDFIASNGACGLARTVYDGMVGSDVANLSILGYDPRIYYTGRGPIEAAALGIELGDMAAYRCNFVTVENGILKDYSAGHITDLEAKILAEELRAKLGVDLHHGVGYRNVLVFDELGESSPPPHDVMGQPVEKNLPRHQRLKELMLSSRDVLEFHEVNRRRREDGKNVANMIWIWGGGRMPKIPKFQDKHRLSGAVISAVDVVRGVGRMLGMQIVNVPGATGYLDTNYEGKADHALKKIEDVDLVFVHVEAPDEASHEGSLEKKIKAIEDFDRRLVGRILDNAPECRILLLTDHYTPLSVRTHTSEPVPFAIMGKERDGTRGFSEREASKGKFGVVEGCHLMQLLR